MLPLPTHEAESSRRHSMVAIRPTVGLRKGVTLEYQGSLDAKDSTRK